MQKIIGSYYAEYDHDTRLWSVLKQTEGKRKGPYTPIRYPTVVKIWFPRWVSSKLLKLA